MGYDVRDFKREVIERSATVPVLVDFWAEWCAPCRMLSPILERLADASNGVWVLAKVDTEEHQDVAAAYGIQGIPAVKLFFEGKVIAEFVGALPEHAVVQWLRKVLPDRYRGKIELADSLAREGRTRDAEAVLEGVLREQQDNQPARELLAKLHLFDDPGRASELLGADQSPPGELGDAMRAILDLLLRGSKPQNFPEHAVRRPYLAAIEELRSRRFDQALEHFIGVIREERYYDDDGARKACIAIFKYLGEDHPLTLKYRRDFSNALY